MRSVVSLLAGIAMVALATAAMGAHLAAGAGDDNPDVLEVRHYVLTLDKAQKTATAMQSINQLIAANPSLNAALDASGGSTGKKPITQQAKDIDSQYPQLASIIHANGLATREFIVVTGAIINDVGWVSMKKGGMVPAYPPGMITPENAVLIEGNWDTFQAIAGKMTPPNTR
jgi:hypothetical protein